MDGLGEGILFSDIEKRELFAHQIFGPGELV